MTLLKYCTTCMFLAPYDPDLMPDPPCRFCKGTGYIKPNNAEKKAFWKRVSREYA